MTIQRVRPGGFAVGDKVTSAEFNGMDLNPTYALDKRAAQTDTLESLVTLGATGRIIQSVAPAPNADTTYQIDGQVQHVRIGTPNVLTATRSYTLSNTNASNGDEISFFFDPAALGTFNALIKDNGGATLAELGPSGEAYWGEFKFISGAWKLKRLGSRLDLAIEAPGCRLSVDNADTYTRAPITDAVAATAVGLAPFDHDRIPLWNGTRWVSRKLPAFATNKITLSGLTSGKNYDVFAYWDSATSSVKLELSAAWTNDTTRADALAMVPTTALVTKNSDPTRLYVGTFRATAATTTEDSKSKRFVWSMYNRVERDLVVNESNVSWTYAGGGVIRQARASAANQVEYVVGLGEDVVEAHVSGMATAAAGNVEAYVGIGVDSTTVNSASIRSGLITPGAVGTFAISAAYRGRPGYGYHKLVWLEASDAGTATFYGTSGSSIIKSGVVATMRG